MQPRRDEFFVKIFENDHDRIFFTFIYIYLFLQAFKTNKFQTDLFLKKLVIILWIFHT